MLAGVSPISTSFWVVSNSSIVLVISRRYASRTDFFARVRLSFHFFWQSANVLPTCDAATAGAIISKGAVDTASAGRGLRHRPVISSGWGQATTSPRSLRQNMSSKLNSARRQAAANGSRNSEVGSIDTPTRRMMAFTFLIRSET